MTNFEKLKKRLADLKITDVEFLEHKPITTVEEGLTEIGIETKNGVSTLIFKTNKGYLGVFRRDDRALDKKKLKELLGIKTLEFAKPEEIKKEFDYEDGVVSVYHEKLKYVMDASLLEREKLYGGVGDPRFDIVISPDDLKKLTDAQVLEFTVEGDAKRSLIEQTLVTGITPSSSKGLHLGNYLGAVKPHVEFQDKVAQGNYFIADYHALNMVHDPEVFRSNVRGTYLDYLALGIEPERENVNFYIESGVPEITELNIILNNVVTMAELKRMHAYKDKFQKGVSEDSINHGLFNYPVLMAADILIFGADFVPVGEDQKQHVEITRDIAQSFNRRYGDVLTVPDVYIKEDVARVIGIDGKKKMSKSLGNDLPIFATEEEIRKQIFATITDPARIHPDDPGDPAKNPIFSYMKLMDYDEAKRTEFEARYKQGTVGDVEIKKAFYEFFLEYFKEARERREKLVADEAGVDALIKKNNEEVREHAQEMMMKVRKAVGVDR